MRRRSCRWRGVGALTFQSEADQQRGDDLPHVSTSRQPVALSIVSTLYRSAPYLEEFYQRSVAAAEQLTADFEIVLVNDGSPDESLTMAVALHQRDARIRVVDLSRNFGHHRAMMIGLRHARGARVFLIDCDLEVAPETLLEFDAAFSRGGVDVVFGVQATRHDLWVITGFTQLPLSVTKRWKGKTSYGLARRAGLLVHAVFSFSSRPLELIFWLGALSLLAALLGAAYLVVRWAFFGGFLVGWASVVVSIWLFGGMIMLSVGTIGFYVGKIFIETKRRPYAIVREVFERDACP
jgi:putative glycosyltransferase